MLVATWWMETMVIWSWGVKLHDIFEDGDGLRHERTYVLVALVVWQDDQIFNVDDGYIMFVKERSSYGVVVNAD